MRKILIKTHRILGKHWWYYHCTFCDRWATWWESWEEVADHAQLHWDTFHK